MKKGHRMAGLGLVLFFAAIIYGCVVGTTTAPPPAQQLMAEDLRVTELGMFPDFVVEGQRVRFSLTIFNRSPYSGRARIMIRDKDQVVAEVHDITIRPRGNAVRFPFTDYRFSRHDHCFTVLVDIAGTYREVDLAKRFCAQRTANGWTLKDN
jgi:hypothetical protein